MTRNATLSANKSLLFISSLVALAKSQDQAYVLLISGIKSASVDQISLGYFTGITLWHLVVVAHLIFQCHVI